MAKVRGFVEVYNDCFYFALYLELFGLSEIDSHMNASSLVEDFEKR